MTNLNKQVYIYSLDTNSFYNDEELNLHNELMEARLNKKRIKGLGVNYKKDLSEVIKNIADLKDKLKIELNANENIRYLRDEEINPKNVISIFDSTLTRTLGINENTLSEDLIVVKVYHNRVMEDLIKYGFMYKDEKFVYLSSSAGQIRNKKTVFIRESVWISYKDNLMCGLSIEEINNKGGSNVNKFLAYLSLSSSASEEWSNFDINKTIVVDDLETLVNCEVDYINHENYKITRKVMGIPITHTDGCGMILPRKSKKSFMIRLPWVKGLLVPFPFDKFAEEHSSFIVKDIYGQEHDIRDVEIIFTKSQFKMAKYYSSWQEYKDKYTQFNCKAAKLNQEENKFNEVKLNYQMLQTLSDITDGELTSLSQSTNEDIEKVKTDKDTMLKILGVTDSNTNKNYLQQGLSIYPELLNDEYCKQAIKDKKKSMVKQAKAAKLNIDGIYTYICPDLYAFCERLLLGIEQPKGLLHNGEVYCNKFDNRKLDILRSPHLYREHGVRENVVDREKGKWYITKGIYTSVHDSISKMLQFDNDGDKVIVTQNELLVNIAERNMKDTVPLYYEMAKAGAEIIDSESLFMGLTLAFKANIGEVSNSITKIWNSANIDLNVIKWLCMEGNFSIDFCKTLYMPTRPEHIDKIIKSYINPKIKVPYFFINAKKKKKEKVEVINNSAVNRLNSIIKNPRINFTKVAGNFDYKLLMKKRSTKLDQEIINTYEKLDKKKKWLIKNENEISTSAKLYVYELIREELLKLNGDEVYVTDVLVKYLYDKKNSPYKSTLWNSFGDVIVRNLNRNLKKTKQCGECGDRITIAKGKRYCESCAQNKEKARLKNRKLSKEKVSKV